MDSILKVVQLLSAARTVVGALIAINAAYQMADNKSHGRGDSGGEEWWTLVKGAILAVVGASSFLVSVVNGLSLG